MAKKRNFWKDGLYWLFRSYLQFFHDKVYYRHFYKIDAANVPPVGTPVLVACNHQNSINDPLALELGFGSRVVSIFARGDVFSRPMVASFLRALYILPAYRLKQDGEESLGKNFDAFSEANDRLLNGNTVAIFPEGTNQDKHWLGEFSLGYLRMAFSAAEACNFKQEIFVLPVANHYSNYFHMQADVMLRFGKPVSLQPYYELYKTKPRTAQRQVNALVRQQICDMMLNVEDVENYEAIDYLRNSYGVDYALHLGKNPKVLPEKLEADKKLCDALQQYKAEDAAAVTELYAQTLELKQQTKALRVRDWTLGKPFKMANVVLRAIGFLLLLPLYLVALVPNIILFYAPKKLVRKFVEKGGTFVMFGGGVQYILTSIVTAPICYSVVFVTVGLLLNWWIALIHLCMLPFLGVFAWHYRLCFIKWKSEIRLHRIANTESVRQVMELRQSIWQTLDAHLK